MKPSRDKLLKMAQSEAFKQMGGSMFAGMKMNNKEDKQKYIDLVSELYRQYLIQFRGEELGGEENMDTSSNDKEYQEYLKSIGNI